MASILDLPAELLLRITEHLPFHAVKATSLTNSQVHKFLQPSMFKCLRATNRKDDEADIRSAMEKYGRHIEKLDFEVHLTSAGRDDDSLYNVGNEPGDLDRESAPAHSTTAFARDLLSGQLLPDISEWKLTFMPADEFEGSDWGDDVGCGTIYIHDNHETQDEVAEREQSLPWRASINEAYQALASRTGIKKLQLLKVIPRACSTFYTAEWQAFLGTFEELRFDLWGGDNGAGWHSNSVPGYLDFCSELNELFFAHLKRLIKLKLVADSQNPMGLDGGNHHLPTPIEPADMPRLVSLEMENFFVDPALVDFVGSHNKQLASLTLIDCLATSQCSDGDAYRWSDFFRALRKHEPTLNTLSVTNTRVPLTRDEEFHREGMPFVPSEDESDRTKLVRRRLSEQPGLRLWPYCYLDDKYGIVFFDEEDILEGFETGADQQEYDALMDLVRRNRTEG